MHHVFLSCTFSAVAVTLSLLMVTCLALPAIALADSSTGFTLISHVYLYSGV